jgi:AcrR family transcriptional regulator
MRSIAAIAQTNTPAVYRRFRNRDAILRALVESYQRELFEAVEPCRSLEEVAECVLNFALRHPREYELMMSGLLAKITKSRPNLEFVVAKSAKWLGGSPEDQRVLVLTVWSLMHGTIMLTISGTLPEHDVSKAHATFKNTVRVLVENREKLLQKTS